MAGAAVSPFANRTIKQLTTDRQTGETNLVTNTLAHAALGALEAKVTGNNAAAGAMAGAGGELAAHFAAKAYGVDGKTKTTQDLTEQEKATVKTLGQLGGMAAGGLIGDNSQSAVSSMQIAERAVDNNLLSKQKNEMVYDAGEEYHKKGMLPTHKQQKVLAALVEDSEIDRLIMLHQNTPEKMTVDQKAYLDNTLKVIAASYNIPVENLYNWDFSKTIARDDSDLKTYLNSQAALQNSYDMKQAQSLKEGLELVGTGRVITKVGAEAAAKVAASKAGQSIGNVLSRTGLKEARAYLTNTTKKYPILTEKLQDAGLSMGFTYLGNLQNGKETSVSDLLWSGGTGLVTSGKSFTATLGINTVSSAVQAATEGKDPIYASFSTAASTMIGGATGKAAEKLGYRALAGDTSRYKANYDRKYRKQEYYDLGNEEYKYHSAKWGRGIDSYTTEYTKQKLDNNEQNIKNWIKENNNEK